MDDIPPQPQDISPNHIGDTHIVEILRSDNEQELGTYTMDTPVLPAKGDLITLADIRRSGATLDEIERGDGNEETVHSDAYQVVERTFAFNKVTIEVDEEEQTSYSTGVTATLYVDSLGEAHE